MRHLVGGSDVDHTNMMPGGILPQVIEDLVQAEGRMLAALEKIDSSLADRSGYESIAGHINSALASTTAALAAAHNKLHES